MMKKKTMMDSTPLSQKQESEATLGTISESELESSALFPIFSLLPGCY